MNEINSDIQSWDTICRKCGRCCYEKLEDGRGKIIYTQNACQYLNLETHQCTIFEQRFERNPLCVQLTPELVSELHWLPVDCAYRPPTARFTRKSSTQRRKRGKAQYR